MKATENGKGTNPPAVTIDPAKSKLDTAALDAAFGEKGTYKGGVYKVVFGRTTKMGDGDFATSESDLQGVLKSLRHSGISAVAIHQHMTGEAPRVMFLHYLGFGHAADLAKGVKAAVDTQHP